MAPLQRGELALRPKVSVVAYMPWEGYNYEDAILISEKLVQEDVYMNSRQRNTRVKTETNRSWDQGNHWKFLTLGRECPTPTR